MKRTILSFLCAIVLIFVRYPEITDNDSTKKEEICIDDLINIIEKHPDWDYDIRFPGVIKK
jgi:hypothetical protein